jgi:hypothetical protein
MRPRDLCAALLRALQASEGRRRRRLRDTTPDALGLAIKRALLERAVADDPDPEAFEAWLVEQCQQAERTISMGAARAMALEILHEWRLASVAPAFAAWLSRGGNDEAGAAEPFDMGGPDMAPKPPDARSVPAQP